MALIDTSLDTVKDALGDVTELAAESLATVSDTLSDLAADQRSRKGLVLFLILVVLALVGIIAWKKSSGSSEPDTAVN